MIGLRSSTSAHWHLLIDPPLRITSLRAELVRSVGADTRDRSDQIRLYVCARNSLCLCVCVCVASDDFDMI